MLRIIPFLSLLILGGCAAPFLTVDDVIVGPPKSAMIVACLEKEPLFGVRDGVENAYISFYADEIYLGTATTDEHGAALLHCPKGKTNFDPPVATATWQNRVLTAQGRLFVWSTGRTAIAVDVDHTICDTDFDDLCFEPIDDDSEPIGNSPEVLTELARDYDIVYLTARPRLLAEKTRAWISATAFPPGPLLASPGWRDVLLPEKYKRKTLANLRRHLPNLLVALGIADRFASLYAKRNAGYQNR